MRRLNYDFTSLENIFYEGIQHHKLNNRNCFAIKKELNSFFKDSICDQVYYTENNDKMFFGMKVFAKLNSDQIEEYLMGTDDVRLTNYIIEIDSHLFNPILSIDSREFVALLLHEIGHVINDTTPIRNARTYLDEYLAKNKETLTITASHQYREILSFALTDFIAKQGSAFYSGNVDEILADDFVRAYGYSDNLDSALHKIMKNFRNLYSGNSNIDKFAVFLWTLQIYKHLGTRRIAAIKTLKRAKALTGSRIEKSKIDAIIQNINRIDNSSLITEANIAQKIKARMKKMKYNTMKTLEDDYYELNMRIRNVEEEEDALYLMRQLNTRLSLIEDYINSEDMTPEEVKRWTNSMDKFKRLRDELSNTMVYKAKSYGIFVNYPDIKEDNY